MNDRLKELAKQARIHMISEPRLQEFAELIIADAIEIVAPDSYHQAYPDNVIGSYGGLELLYHKVAKIKRHFDV